MRLFKSVGLLSLACLFVGISSKIQAQVGIGANIGPEPVRPYEHSSEPLPAREQLNSRFAAGLSIPLSTQCGTRPGFRIWNSLTSSCATVTSLSNLPKLFPITAVEQRASGFLAHPHGSSVAKILRCAAVRPSRQALAPLLEEERHAGGMALVAQRSRPIRMHGPRAWPTLPAADHPVELRDAINRSGDDAHRRPNVSPLRFLCARLRYSCCVKLGVRFSCPRRRKASDQRSTTRTSTFEARTGLRQRSCAYPSLSA
jgi:hypothetical protein